MFDFTRLSVLSTLQYSTAWLEGHIKELSSCCHGQDEQKPGVGRKKTSKESSMLSIKSGSGKFPFLLCVALLWKHSHQHSYSSLFSLLSTYSVLLLLHRPTHAFSSIFAFSFIIMLHCLLPAHVHLSLFNLKLVSICSHFEVWTRWFALSFFQDVRLKLGCSRMGFHVYFFYHCFTLFCDIYKIFHI